MEQEQEYDAPILRMNEFGDIEQNPQEPVFNLEVDSLKPGKMYSYEELIKSEIIINNEK